MALICWLFGGAGMIYGSGAFAAVHMVDHGATAHFVFLTFVIGSVVLFPGLLIPAVVIRAFGVEQSRVVLEEVST